MKNRPQGKKMGIILLAALIIISLAEVIFRATAMGLEAVLTTANFGEQLAIIALAATILILTAKGKDRACYICYGAWAGYFILDQLFELPGAVSSFLTIIDSGALTLIPFLLRIVGMICIVAIGVILVEYMSDGTICNRAFNALCAITILAFIAYAVIVLVGFIDYGTTNYFLAIFNILYHILMVFLFTFFAYDSAKHQLKKTNLTK